MVEIARWYEKQGPVRVDHAKRLQKLEHLVDRLFGTRSRDRKLQRWVNRPEGQVDSSPSPKRRTARRG